MEFYEEIAKVKKPSGSIREKLLASYEEIGHRHGYKKLKSPVHLLLFRNKDTAAVEINFGNEKEFLDSLRKLVENKADFNFFVTSSAAHTMRLEEVRSLLLKNFQTEQRFFLIDIETGRTLKVGFEWEKFTQSIESREFYLQPNSLVPPKPLFRERRKKTIYGKRGEHKEQD
jgi:uncharacterized protein YcgL (UPF0745 family)